MILIHNTDDTCIDMNYYMTFFKISYSCRHVLAYVLALVQTVDPSFLSDCRLL